MKKTQLLSVVFSLIMFTGLTAGTLAAYAELEEDDKDFDDRLEYFCEMTDAEKDKLFEEHPRLAPFEERLTNFCDLEEEEREDLIDELIEEHFPNYKDHNDWDLDDVLDKYCEMSKEDKAEFLEKYPMASDHKDEMEEYCSLDDSGRDAFIEEHKDEYEMDRDYKKHDYKMREKMDNFCDMSEEERTSHIEEHNKNKEHLAEMEEYCSLDDSGRDAFIEDNKEAIMDKMSAHKDAKKEEISVHKDTMKDQISAHKDSMKSDHKSDIILRASTLTHEQKDEIKAKHAELRDFKQSLRNKSISDFEKQEIREQFIEKAKEFSLTWLSPRHQVAAGIDVQSVECREEFELIMKTSNASPMCVKETTAEKLIERGIAISAI